MPVPEHLSPEQKMQLRIEALNKENKRLRETSKKQSSKISQLRLWFYFTIVFSASLFIFLLVQGFISVPDTTNTEIKYSSVDTVYIEKAINPDSLKKITYNTHEAAIPKKDYDGIIFAIQIGAYKDLDLSKYKDNMLGLKQDTYDSINQFTLGEFIEYEQAQDFLQVVQQMGFEQAHIMSFKNGYRIRLESALAERKDKRTTANTTSTKHAIKAQIEEQVLLR
ncbi:hypothetical protein [Carboxylicivirga taeanensis]|uniref:hypothetical protein n=1 Tax=Carboxylicivirga taeanensis TaxID=1416875 RepID=UPI003F6E0642